MKRRAGAGNLALLCLSLINSSPVTGRKKPPRLTTAAAPKDLTTFRSAKDENNEQEREPRVPRGSPSAFHLILIHPVLKSPIWWLRHPMFAAAQLSFIALF